MDFTFHIQNFTTATFSKAVKPGQQATVGYSFVPADAFAGRPIGLTINLNYRDAAGNFFMDFTFHIQNFTTATFSKAVKPGQQATVGYSFVPADAFAGRPIGLTINLNYRDAAGNFFIDPVFNETVQIVEFDEGFDTETFFMYVCMAGAVVLLLFLGFNYLSGKKTSRSTKVVETGTEGDDGVDYEWIPKSALRNTPASGKTSPRQRKNKAGSDSD